MTVFTPTATDRSGDAVFAANFPSDTQVFQAPANGGNCYEFYDGDNYNCAIGICWTDKSKGAIGIVVKGDYQVVKEDCSPHHAGGQSIDGHDDGYYVTVRYNADYVPQSEALANVTKVNSQPPRQHARDLLQPRAVRISDTSST